MYVIQYIWTKATGRFKLMIYSSEAVKACYFNQWAMLIYKQIGW